MPTLLEPARQLPVKYEADLCVLGGSCTGVFAAVRAARLGARVVIVEQQNLFGGTATAGKVNIWHSLNDAEQKQQIIAGLTLEMLERLQKRDAVIKPNTAWRFNSDELSIELDAMVLENNITPLLHTRFSQPMVEDGKLTAVIAENKSGRFAIKAKFFIDATGDGDLCHRLGLPSYVPDRLQPPTACALFGNWKPLENADWEKALVENAREFNLPDMFAWGVYIPNTEVFMLAGTRVYGRNCAEADDLIFCEMETRRQVRAIMDILKRAYPESHLVLQGLPAYIGIRETRHIQCAYRLTGDDVLYGKRFPDAISNASIRVDIHHQDKPGITFRYLDGREDYCPARDTKPVPGRWRPETKENPTFYQIPFRTLIPGKFGNLLLAGRMLDADPVAFAAVRQMINLNQAGEATGVAAWHALDSGKNVLELDPQEIRKTLAQGGSIVL